MDRKTIEIRAKAANGKPSSEQLAAINVYALDELTADQVYVRTAYLAHNGIDRDNEVFDGALLRDFARSLPGKGLFVRHPGGWDGDSGPGVGRWFEARVVQMSMDEARTALGEPNLQWPDGTEQAELLEAGYYLPRSDKNTDLIVDVNAGVASYVSIGFQSSQRTDIMDANGNVIARRLHAPGEALEGSLVWLGAQPGARTVKSFERSRAVSGLRNAAVTREHLAPSPVARTALRDPNRTLRALAGDYSDHGAPAVKTALRDPEKTAEALAQRNPRARQSAFVRPAGPNEAAIRDASKTRDALEGRGHA